MVSKIAAVVLVLVASLGIGSGRACGQEVRIGGRALREWAEMLETGTTARKLEALEGIGRFGWAARFAFPALGKALSDESPAVRAGVLVLIMKLDHGARGLETEIRGALGDPDGAVRVLAARVLGRIFTLSSPSLEALIGCLDDENRALAQEAYRALAKNRRFAVPALLKALRSDVPGIRARVADLLGGAMPRPAVTQALVGALRDPIAAVRAAAAKALGRAGLAGGPARESLLALADDPDPVVRSAAFCALAEEKPEDERFRRLLREGLRSRGSDVCWTAVVVVKKSGDGAKAYIPELVEILKTGDDDCALTASLVLGRLGREAVRPLVQALESPGNEARLEAAQALADLGPLAAEAVEALVPLLADRVAPVRLAAVAALGAVGAGAGDAAPSLCRLLATCPEDHVGLISDALAGIGRPSVEAIAEVLAGAEDRGRRRAVVVLRDGFDPDQGRDLLLRALDDPSAAVAVEAAGARPARESRPEKALGILKGALSHEDPVVRLQAARILADWAEGGETGVKALARILADGALGLHLRRDAALELGRLGPRAEAAKPQLLAGCADPAEEIRNAAVRALGGLAPEPDVVGALIAALKDPSAGIRESAASSLGRGSGGSRDAVAALVTALDDGEVFVRRAAVEALRDADPAGDLTSWALEVRILEGFRSRPERGRRAALSLGRRAVPALLAVLSKGDLPIQRWVLGLLKEMGDEAGAAAPALVRLVASETEWALHEEAGDALASMGGKGFDALRARLRDADPAVAPKARCLRVLGRFTDGNPAVVAELESVLRDPEGDPAGPGGERGDILRSAAAEGLGMLGPRAVRAVPVLLEALGGGRPDVQVAILRALGEIGLVSRDVLRTLEDLAAHGAPAVRPAAVQVLEKLRSGR